MSADLPGAGDTLGGASGVEVPAAGTDLSASAPPRLPLSVLLIESNALLRDYLQHLVRARFPHVRLTAAGGGDEALSAARISAPDLVYVHLRPGDGRVFALIRELRQLSVRARVVFLSDHDLPEYREAALRSGADQCLETGAVRAADLLGLVGTAGEPREPPTPLRP